MVYNGGLNPQSFGEYMPWHKLKDWSPFSFDALGLITLLGEKEVNANVGSLQSRRWSEYLPLLAGFVVAGDRFAQGEPGFMLYNITDGITTPALKFWFTRWLALQSKVNRETTTFRFTLDQGPPKSETVMAWVSFLVSYLVIIALLVTTVFMGDWPGVANFGCMLTSMAVRAFLLRQRRTAVTKIANDQTKPRSAEEKTVFVVRADGSMVTVIAPSSIVGSFVRDCPLPNPRWYKLSRLPAWLAFGGQVCILGMSSLFTQLFTVAIIVISTWFYCSGVDFDIGRQALENQEDVNGITCRRYLTRPFGTNVTVIQEDPLPKPGVFEDRRQYAYLRPGLTPEQELMLVHWSLLPARGVPWVQDYKRAEKDNPDEALGLGHREILDDYDWYKAYSQAKEHLPVQTPAPHPAAAAPTHQAFADGAQRTGADLAPERDGQRGRSPGASCTGTAVGGASDSSSNFEIIEETKQE